MKTDNKQLFEEMPVTKAVISLVIPYNNQSAYNRHIQHGGYIFYRPDK